MELEDREYKSKTDKNLKIVRVKNSGLFTVKFVGGGELPDELKAMWTTPALAEAAIEKYMRPKPKAKRGPAKKEEASG